MQRVNEEENKEVNILWKNNIWWPGMRDGGYKSLLDGIT